MPGFNQPGDTVRLEAPWEVDTGGAADNNGWAVHVGADHSSTSDPDGWVVNLVSGSYGAADLVVDVTIPDPLTVTNSSKGNSYDFGVRFDHKAGSGSSVRSGFFSLSVTDIANPKNTKFDTAPHPAGFYIAAVLESDGVHFWRVDGAISGKVEVSNLPGAFPSIWFDGRGALWCLLSDYSDPRLSDAVAWNLYRSNNIGRTWSDPILMPWESPRGAAQAKGSVENSMLSFSTLTGGNTSGYIRRSHDNGVTWTDPVNTGVAVIGDPRNAYQTYPVQLSNGVITGDPVFGRCSRDFGRTWSSSEFPTFIPPPLSPALDTLLYIHVAPAQRNGHAMMSMNVGVNFSNGKIQCGRTAGLQGGVIANADIDDSAGEWFQILSIPKTWESSTWKITNGRDRQYRSDDLGQTWGAD